MKKLMFIYPLIYGVIFGLFANMAVSEAIFESDVVIDAAISAVDEVDVYTVDLTLGESIHVRVADLVGSDLYPYIRIRDLNGALVTSDGDRVVAASLSVSAKLSGEYTIEVRSGDGANLGSDDIGSYRLYFIKAPGSSEFGLLSAVDERAGEIELGDIDTYTFVAEAGQRVNIRVADIEDTDFYPYLYVYDPAGKLIASEGGYQVAASRNLETPETGTYTIAVTAGHANGLASTQGLYNLYFAKSVGANELGLLNSHDERSGEIELGDIDTYTFISDVGQRVNIRVADTEDTEFYPFIHVYDPNGHLIANEGGYQVAAVRNLVTPDAGTYIIVVSAGHANGLNATHGLYDIYYANSVGANELSTLVKGEFVDEEITLGDIDSYTFTAVAGERIHLRLADIDQGELYPFLYLYGPDGKLLDSAGEYTVAAIDSFNIPVSGTHTVIVLAGHANGADQTQGHYRLNYATSIDTQEYGVVENNQAISGEIDLGDLDTYSFSASQGDPLLITLTETLGVDFYPSMTLYAPDGSLFKTAGGYSEASISLASLTQAGNYTLIVHAGHSNGLKATTGSYDLVVAVGENSQMSSVQVSSSSASITIASSSTAFVSSSSASSSSSNEIESSSSIANSSSVNSSVSASNQGENSSSGSVSSAVSIASSSVASSIIASEPSTSSVISSAQSSITSTGGTSTPKSKSSGGSLSPAMLFALLLFGFGLARQRKRSWGSTLRG